MLNNKNNKGQISIFIIIAVILLIVSIFLFVNSQTDFFLSAQQKQTNQFTDVVNYCVENSANQGIFLLGFQGGYINVTPEIRANPNRHTDFGLIIPNWDSQRGEIPTIESMENELDSYITNNAQECIRTNLNDLENQFNIDYDLNSFEINSQINKENVQFEIELPIEFNEINSQDSFSVSDYFINLEEVRLGNLYELAVEIYNLELDSNLFEELTMDQIYSASDYTSDVSMPSEGMHFSCTRRFWTKPQLQENLANLNNNNFKYLHFRGTFFNSEVFDANLNGENQDLQQYYEKQYSFDLNNPQESFENYKVGVSMPSTEVTGNEGFLQSYPFRDFDVTPSSGQLVKPIRINIPTGGALGLDIPIPCIQLYHHLYTLDYDLIITLTDMNEDAEQFFFNFPMRVQVDENIPKEQSFTPIANTFDQVTATSQSYCEPEQMLYPVTVFVRDVISTNYLSEANISYNCLSLSCEMGETQRPTFRGIERNTVPRFEGEFPTCINGEVIAEAEGYHQLPNTQSLDTTQDLLNREQTLDYEVEMAPLKKFEIDAYSFLAVDKDTNRGDRVLNDDDGTFYVSLENDKYDFQTQAMWPNNGEYLNNIELLELEDVKYNVSIIYMDGNSKLRGLLEVEDYALNPSQGNQVEIVIPSSSEEITQEEFLPFYEHMEKIIDSLDYVEYGRTNYGITFK